MSFVSIRLSNGVLFYFAWKIDAICKMDQVSDVVFSCRLAKHLLKKLLKHVAFIFCKLVLRNIFGQILAVLLDHLPLRATIG